MTCSADQEGAGGADADAIHENVSGEIAAIAAKATPVSGDLLLIEDSAASNAKKHITVGSLFGDITVNSITVAPSAIPTIPFRDSDMVASDKTIAHATANCTDCGDGTEDGDWTLSTQTAGTMTARITVDGDGRTAIPRQCVESALDPTEDEDSGEGYYVGQCWINTATTKEFVALDVTVAGAVWKRRDGIESVAHIDADVINADTNADLMTHDNSAIRLTLQTVTADTDTISPGTVKYGTVIKPVTTSGGSINLVSNPQIADGTDGQTVTFCGTSNTNVVVLDNGSGLELLSSISLLNNVCMELQYVASSDTWKETSPRASVTGTATHVPYFGGGGTLTTEAALNYDATNNVLAAESVATTCDPATTECGWLDVPLETAEPSDTADVGTGNVVLRTNIGLQSRQGNGTTISYARPDHIAHTAATVVLTFAHCHKPILLNSDADAIDFTLPADELECGMCFYDAAGGIITVDPGEAGDTIIGRDHEGNAIGTTAGEAIDLAAGIGHSFCLSTQNGDTWLLWPGVGAVTDGGAD